MMQEFNTEELKEVTRSARAYNPAFNEQKMQNLIELQKRLSDSGYLETIGGVAKLEKEQGVSLNQVIERVLQLLRDNTKLDQKVAVQRSNSETLAVQIKEKERKLQEIVKATELTTEQLRQVKQECDNEERRIITYRKKADMEKRGIDNEVSEYRRKADVTEKDIATASQIKQEVEKRGFSLELTLNIAQEFTGYEDAQERLGKALKTEGTLTNYVTTLGDKTKTLEESHSQMEEELSVQAKEHKQHNEILSKLKIEIAEKKELVGFYHRYIHLRPLIDYLGNWNQLTFHHCLWCGAHFWILRPGNITISLIKCPWCSLTMVEADRNAYAVVSQPPGTPLKLLP
jgi:hypothetical protein